MDSYAELEVFSIEEVTLFRQATVMVDALRHQLTQAEQRQVRCHELARAAGLVLDLPVQDGHYGAVNHSWLWTRARSTPRRRHVLDVYAVGRVPMVQLVDAACPGLPEVTSYRVNELWLDEPIDVAFVERLRLCFTATLVAAGWTPSASTDILIDT